MYAELRQLSSFLRGGEVKIDSSMMTLSYKVTMVILVAYSIIITMNSYVGDPIDCIATNTKAPGSSYLDTYCYITGTQNLLWPIKDDIRLDPTVSKSELAIPGYCPKGETCQRRHVYYQWVNIVILLQACMFFFPRYLWYGWEGGRLNSELTSLTNMAKFYIYKDKNTMQPAKNSFYQIYPSGCSRTKNLASQYLGSLGQNKFYISKLLLAEVLTLINSYLQIYLTSWFLGGEVMSQYMTSVSAMVFQFPSERTDVMSIMLPILARCQFNSTGTSGNPIVTESLCVLPNNVIHQKFYSFFIIWLLFVALYSTIYMSFRLVTICSSGIRLAITLQAWDILAVDKQKSDADRFLAFEFLPNLTFADWQVLKMIRQNLAAYNFHLFLEDVAYHAFQNKVK